MTMRALVERTYDVLARQYPPLDDRLRMVFYTALLLTTQHEWFESIPLQLRRCPPELFHAVGVMGLLPERWADPEIFQKLLWAGRAPLMVVWTLAIVGLGGRLPMVLTAAGLTIFWSMNKCCSGTGHGLHLAMYTLIVLALYARPGAWSLDAWIARRWARYPFRPRAHVDATGLARYIILGLAVYTLFAGGLSKLRVSGLYWMDGETLQLHILHMNHPKGAFGQWLLDLTLDHRWLAAILASWTILLEVGSGLALFFRRVRNLIIVNAWAFHLGIYFMMLPRYFPQMSVYLLVFHWGGLLRRTAPYLGRLAAPPVQPAPVLPPSFGHKARNVAFVAVLVGVLAFIWIRQREWYPFTHIPMYSDHLTAESFAGHRVADFDSVEGFTRISQAYDAGQQGWFFTFWLPKRVEVRGVAWDADGSVRTADLTEVMHRRLSNSSVWGERLAHAVMSEFHRYPAVDGRLRIDREDSHLTHYLRAALRLLDKTGALAEWDEVHMVLHLGDSDEVVLSALPAVAPVGKPKIKPAAPGYR